MPRFPSPPVRPPLPIWSVPFPGQLPNLLFHDQPHQLQPRFPQQIPHSLLQKAHHFAHRQQQLNRWVLFRDQVAEHLNGFLPMNLISLRHSDSPFFAQHPPRTYQSSGQESRYFLRTNGHPRFLSLMAFRAFSVPVTSSTVVSAAFCRRAC